ncbi:MAG TPA: small ribosomal subunit Rsm22 family protein [Chloroflexia bacterium]|nr:small ribosomal subunit Rsm22 family protein [Chloroflexia bacterium]
MLTLPPDLEAAVAAVLREMPSSQWQSAARQISQRYRDADEARRTTEATRTQSPFRGPYAAVGYAALVLPATYAQLWAAMCATALRAPNFQPTTMLDLGSGPGTALWAAVEHWPDIETADAWEREPASIDLGKRLASASEHPAVNGARWRQIALTGALPPGTPTYDLIVIGHVLNELTPDVRDALVASAWEHCTGLLLIVEPGTSSAFPIVLRAREVLLESGAHTIAPCAHDLPCPLPADLPNDWCHFPQRLQRPAFQRVAKEASAGWEEAKFSYAAMSRFAPDTPIYARLIHQPHPTKIGVDLTLSARDGTITRPRIPKRDRPAYREAANLHWGEAILQALDK